LLISTSLEPALHAQIAKPTCSDLDPKNGLRLATGPSGGSYDKLGEILADKANGAHMPVQLCRTQGSIDNIAAISAGNADLAFVQSDNMLDTWSHTGISVSRPDVPQRITLLARLYSERLHLLVNEDGGIYSIANLKMKDVWLGPEGSGSRKLAFEVLHAAGFDDNDIYLMDYCPQCPFDKALGDLVTGKIAAVFRATSVPTRDSRFGKTAEQNCGMSTKSPIINKMCSDPEIRLFSLNDVLLHDLIQNPRYCPALIPRNVYPNQNYAVQTLGVEAMLVTKMAENDLQVKALYDLLHKNRASIEEDFGTVLDLFDSRLEGSAAQELSSHVHRQVSSRILPSNAKVFLARLSIVFALFLVVWLLMRPSSDANVYRNRLRLGSCLLFLLLLWLFLGCLLFWTESRFNADYNTPWEASWSALGHYAHGLQTPTMTPAGREIAFFGLGAFFLFIGSLRSAVVDNSIDRVAKWFAIVLMPDHNTDKRQAVAGRWSAASETCLRDLVPDERDLIRRTIVLSTSRFFRRRAMGRYKQEFVTSVRRSCREFCRDKSSFEHTH